jgi:hypothetical protein
MRLAGVEREWRVLAGDDVIDFRTVIDDLDLDGRRLDPDDPHAHRCGWGGVVTADGQEAEVATPPLEVRAGVTWQLEALAAAGRSVVRGACRDSWTLDGYSTHLNVGTDDRSVTSVADRFTRHLAPAQMLLLDRRSSPGLLVRPRRGRLEIGGEYSAGSQLRAALAVAIAGTVACEERGGAWRRVPTVAFTPQRAVGRYGWYVDRRAAGVDLYAVGRDARLDTDRGPMSAQSYLVAAWEALRETGTRLLDRNEVALVDAMVDGDLPLPLELPEDDPVVLEGSGSAHGPVFDDIVRPGFVVRPVVARWDSCAFTADDGRRALYLVLDAAEVPDFLAACAKGRYDAQIRRVLMRGRLALRRLRPVIPAAAATEARRSA